MKLSLLTSFFSSSSKKPTTTPPRYPATLLAASWSTVKAWGSSRRVSSPSQDRLRLRSTHSESSLIGLFQQPGVTNKLRGWNHLLHSIDPAERTPRGAGERKNVCKREETVWGRQWSRAEREREREAEGGRALCVSAHLYSVLVLPLHPCLFPSLYPSSPLYLQFVPPFLCLSRPCTPTQVGGETRVMKEFCKLRGRGAERKGSELMTHGYWYRSAGAETKTEAGHSRWPIHTAIVLTANIPTMVNQSLPRWSGRK